MFYKRLELSCQNVYNRQYNVPVKEYKLCQMKKKITK